jgi:hypothetical protein
MAASNDGSGTMEDPVGGHHAGVVEPAAKTT